MMLSLYNLIVHFAGFIKIMRFSVKNETFV
jgi:hypothetical protein